MRFVMAIALAATLVSPALAQVGQDEFSTLWTGSYSNGEFLALRQSGDAVPFRVLDFSSNSTVPTWSMEVGAVLPQSSVPSGSRPSTGLSFVPDSNPLHMTASGSLAYLAINVSSDPAEASAQFIEQDQLATVPSGQSIVGWFLHEGSGLALTNAGAVIGFYFNFGEILEERSLGYLLEEPVSGESHSVGSLKSNY